MTQSGKGEFKTKDPVAEEKKRKKENQNVMDHRVSASHLSISAEACSVY